MAAKLITLGLLAAIKVHRFISPDLTLLDVTTSVVLDVPSIYDVSTSAITAQRDVIKPDEFGRVDLRPVENDHHFIERLSWFDVDASDESATFLYRLLKRVLVRLKSFTTTLRDDGVLQAAVMCPRVVLCTVFLTTVAAVCVYRHLSLREVLHPVVTIQRGLELVRQLQIQNKPVRDMTETATQTTARLSRRKDNKNTSMSDLHEIKVKPSTPSRLSMETAVPQDEETRVPPGEENTLEEVNSLAKRRESSEKALLDSHRSSARSSTAGISAITVSSSTLRSVQRHHRNATSQPSLMTNNEMAAKSVKDDSMNRSGTVGVTSVTSAPSLCASTDSVHKAQLDIHGTNFHAGMATMPTTNVQNCHHDNQVQIIPIGDVNMPRNRDVMPSLNNVGSTPRSGVKKGRSTSIRIDVVTDSKNAVMLKNITNQPMSPATPKNVGSRKNKDDSHAVRTSADISVDCREMSAVSTTSTGPASRRQRSAANRQLQLKIQSKEDNGSNELSGRHIAACSSNASPEEKTTLHSAYEESVLKPLVSPKNTATVQPALTAAEVQYGSTEGGMPQATSDEIPANRLGALYNASVSTCQEDTSEKQSSHVTRRRCAVSRHLPAVFSITDASNNMNVSRDATCNRDEESLVESQKRAQGTGFSSSVYASNAVQVGFSDGNSSRSGMAQRTSENPSLILYTEISPSVPVTGAGPSTSLTQPCRPPMMKEKSDVGNVSADVTSPRRSSARNCTVAAPSIPLKTRDNTADALSTKDITQKINKRRKVVQMTFQVEN